ncbi:MAG: bacteriophage Gp15 family protein [Eubacteriales bacterium]|nr:bacteriophage Gp15 family protein [Eubacteriales bacterium]
MDILSQALPDCIIFDGNSYKLNTDFKVWIEFEKIMRNKDLSPIIKIAYISELCFKEVPPACGALFEALLDFYNGGKREKAPAEGNRKPTISFEADGDYIFSAFYSQYGIDLTDNSMHWYKFKALFSGLSEDNMIVKIMHYRSVDISSIKDKNQKEFYRKMKKLYRLEGHEADAGLNLKALF